MKSSVYQAQGRRLYNYSLATTNLGPECRLRLNLTLLCARADRCAPLEVQGYTAANVAQHDPRRPISCQRNEVLIPFHTESSIKQYHKTKRSFWGYDCKESATSEGARWRCACSRLHFHIRGLKQISSIHRPCAQRSKGKTQAKRTSLSKLFPVFFSLHYRARWNWEGKRLWKESECTAVRLLWTGLDVHFHQQAGRGFLTPDRLKSKLLKTRSHTCSTGGSNPQRRSGELKRDDCDVNARRWPARVDVALDFLTFSTNANVFSLMKRRRYFFVCANKKWEMRQADVFSSESINCSATFSSAVFQQWFSSCHSSRCRSAFLNWWVVTLKWVVKLFFRGKI